MGIGFGEVILVTILDSLEYQKDSFREDLRDRLPGILGLFRGLAQKRKGRDFLETVTRYLLAAAPKEHLSREEIHNTVKKTIPRIGGEIMMTIADTYIEEGTRCSRFSKTTVKSACSQLDFLLTLCYLVCA